MEAHAQPATNLRLWEYARELEYVVEELIESGGELTPELEGEEGAPRATGPREEPARGRG